MLGVYIHSYPPAAGTISCTMCHKSPKVIVSTFQPQRLFSLDYPWDVKITMRTGQNDRKVKLISIDLYISYLYSLKALFR